MYVWKGWADGAGLVIIAGLWMGVTCLWFPRSWDRQKPSMESGGMTVAGEHRLKLSWQHPGFEAVAVVLTKHVVSCQAMLC